MKILKHTKNTIWPNRNNTYHPYLLRAPALAFAAACLLLLQVTVNIQQQTGRVLGAASSVEVQQLLELTNRQRAVAGAEPLAADEKLRAAAQAKLADMFRRDYWDHYAPDGTSPWYFVENAGYYYEHAGENLAKNFQTSSGVINGWMQSPGHRQNLLDPRYSEVGMAVATGLIGGKESTVVVALYAQPQPVGLQTASAAINGSTSLPDVVAYSWQDPLQLFSALPPTTQAAGWLAFGFGGLYLTQHLVVRKRHLLWDHRIHPRPELQAAIFFGLVIVLLSTGQGVVG